MSTPNLSGSEQEKPNIKLALVQDDPWLGPYNRDLLDRLERFENRLDEISKGEGGLEAFVHAHHYLGLNYDRERLGWYYREWAPKAHALYALGDFNNWNRESHPLQKNDQGIWEIFFPDSEFGGKIENGTRIKVHVVGDNGGMDRIPAYIKRVIQDTNTTDFSGQFWDSQEFKWTDEGFHLRTEEVLAIYESHTGMAQEKEGLGTYREFEENILPRVKRLGYNAIQLMAVQEHPYYGSFGYHVSNFFAPSSRFGTPDELKSMINKAHEMGIAVIMDVVHSHAVKNLAEGINQFDGSEDQYFHPGGRGEHSGWDSKLFNYGKTEVLQFLLSNIAYWVEEFHFDGFRFDGVTSMLYFHHGEGVSFDHYDKYFKDGVEWDAITYLQLANHLVHKLNPNAITIAEDMSGMPGTCRSIKDGGLGFDYRLAMGLPDYWIKILKHKKDEEWNLHELWHTLGNRRYKEKNVAYAESHDQALVGDKTLAFWLMDKDMYWDMEVGRQNPVIDRGIALHKMIRLITAAVGGEAYLTFMGNEFGHPEWVDFPREGNNWSYKHARRQWSLADYDRLKYKYLQAFDKAMIELLRTDNVPMALPAKELNIDPQNMVIAFERANLIFVFNFHPTNSVPDYKFYVPNSGEYELILNSDQEVFGGFNRIQNELPYVTEEDEYGTSWLSIYNINRAVQVFKRKE
ncbi:MAG: alpha amylase C-terminal domain-containing protein [Bacteroidia bacterium]|nr:alpha amylase C-terminal domain-containing protein [Bacteroidia bacterium]